jgi:hypothetical protein
MDETGDYLDYSGMGQMVIAFAGRSILRIVLRESTRGTSRRPTGRRWMRPERVYPDGSKRSAEGAATLGIAPDKYR